ncbi:glycosyl hydrolase family 18 protein [Cellulosilyticum ruminicola]
MFKKVVMGLTLLALVALAVTKFMPVGDMVDPLTYFDEFQGNEYNLVYKDQRIDLKDPVKIIDGNIYICYEAINNYLNTSIFYDESEQIMTLTEAKNVLRLYPNKDKGLLNGKKVEAPYILKEIDGKLYVSAELLKDKAGIEIIQGEENKLFILDDITDNKQIGTIKRITSLRTRPLKKTTVLKNLKKGEKVVVFSSENGFVRVRSEQGIVGYIPENNVIAIRNVEGTAINSSDNWPSNPLGEKVKLVWDQVTVQTAGDWENAKYSKITEANVISPTWFQFADAKGDLSDLGNKAYIDNAHKRGLMVWALLSHNFTEPQLTAQVLSSTTKRQHVINQLIEKAKTYGYDGVNIDIENIQTETSKVWVQFMRELYPQLKNAGIVVTVDVYMPSDWSNHYERGKIANLCDYFIVMAYDQYHLGSEEAGSVAEIPWVEEGVKKNLEEVPSDKLVLGIPFYTRLWKETANGLETRSYTMSAAEAKVKEWGVIPTLDSQSGQLYAEKQVEDGVYKIWLEDSNTIADRIQIVNKYNLAGYGAWKLGLETLDCWDSLALLKK